MIAAVVDVRGASFAATALRRMFEVASVEPAAPVERGNGVLGYGKGPLVQHAPGPVACATLGVGGAPSLDRLTEAVRLRQSGALIGLAEEGLLLVRGPYGGRPLFYAQHGGVVLACTRLLPILAALDVLPQPDTQRLCALVFAGRDGDPTITPYRGIRRAQPCETILFGAGRIRRSINLPEQPAARVTSVERAAEELRHEILAAVERACSRFSHAAVMTGGGLDSSGLLAAAMAHGRRRTSWRCDTFALDYAEENSDRPHLKALAAHLGITPQRVHASAAASVLPEGFVLDGAPFEYALGPVQEFIARSARARGADVLLTGLGGDVVFEGDLSYLSDGKRNGGWARAAVAAARFRWPWTSTTSGRVWALVARPHLLRAVPGRIRLARRARRLTQTPEWGWAGRVGRQFLLDSVGVESEEQPDWFSELARSAQLGNCAELHAQVATAAGLSIVDPYLDADLVERVAAIPAETLSDGSFHRGLYRRAMRGLLPESLRLRPDKASLEPCITELFETVERRGDFEKLRRVEGLAELGLVEPRPFREALSRHLSKGTSVQGWGPLWGALGVEAFVQAHATGLREWLGAPRAIRARDAAPVAYGCQP